MTASSAVADVVSVDFSPDATLTPGGTVWINSPFTAGATATTNPGTSPSLYFFFYFAQSEELALRGYNNFQLNLTSTRISKLSAGDTVGPALPSWTSGGAFLEYQGNGPWQGSSGEDAYIGLRLNQGGSNFSYGYLTVAYDDSANSVTFKGIAFEQTLNTPITIAAIPEPATSVFWLTIGAAGIAAYRRNKLRVES